MGNTVQECISHGRVPFPQKGVPFPKAFHVRVVPEFFVAGQERKGDR